MEGLMAAVDALSRLDKKLALAIPDLDRMTGISRVSSR
jgi:hypothetical protein